MLTVFYDAPLPVQLHIVAALIAIFLGPFVIWRKRRDRLHKILGYIWVTEMATVAISSFFIIENPVIGPFSPIHGLSAWTLYVLFVGVRSAIRKDIARHQEELRSLYIYGMGIAGSLTMLPGRRLNVMIFGENEMLGLVVIGAVGLVLAGRILGINTRVFSLVKRAELR